MNAVFTQIEYQILNISSYWDYFDNPTCRADVHMFFLHVHSNHLQRICIEFKSDRFLANYHATDICRLLC